MSDLIKRAERWKHACPIDASDAITELVDALQDAQRKVDAYDAARAVVKTEGGTRAYYVLRAKNAEAALQDARVEAESMSRLAHDAVEDTIVAEAALQDAREALRLISRIKPDTRPEKEADNYHRAVEAVEIAHQALTAHLLTTTEGNRDAGGDRGERGLGAGHADQGGVLDPGSGEVRGGEPDPGAGELAAALQDAREALREADNLLGEWFCMAAVSGGGYGGDLKRRTQKYLQADHARAVLVEGGTDG